MRSTIIFFIALASLMVNLTYARVNPDKRSLSNMNEANGNQRSSQGVGNRKSKRSPYGGRGMSGRGMRGTPARGRVAAPAGKSTGGGLPVVGGLLGGGGGLPLIGGGGNGINI